MAPTRLDTTPMDHPATRPTRRPPGARRGVSLLEVLFSIGVVSIGLLGVVALLPLAANQVRKGVQADDAAMVGLNALNRIELQGMSDPSSWEHPNYNIDAVWLDTAFTNSRSFCIDPMFVVDNESVTPPVTTPATNKLLFPYYERGGSDRPRMWRISLKSSPFSSTRMSRLQASRIFWDENRMLFDRPEDDTLDATPRYQLSPSNDPMLRESRGNLSWFATLVPKLGPGSGYGGLYTLSAVVLEDRSGTLDLSLMPDQELLASVTAFYSGGLSGGDVEITAGSQAILEELRAGQWIMLSGKALYAGLQIDRFAWFRVSAMSSEITGTGPFSRDVTLSGPDWSRSEWTSGSQPTDVVIVPGVVGVYQRTIRLEQTNLWR